MDLIAGRVEGAFSGLLRLPDQAHTSRSMLILLHQIMRASVPMMESARRGSQTRSTAEVVCAQLAAYLETHIEEERQHDIWVLEDLETIGVDPANVLARVPPPYVASLVGAQYYWIEHFHPVAILGYMAALEGYPPSGELIDRLQTLSGLPDTAFRTCRKHGDLDPNHTLELDRFLDTLTLTEGQRAVVGISAAHTMTHLAHAFESLASRS